MTQSTVEPKALKLWKLEPTDEGLRLHISAHWNVHQIAVEDDQGSRQEWEYDQIRFIVPYEGTREAVDAFLVAQEARLLLIVKALWGVGYDAPTLTDAEKGLAIDQQTGCAITTKIHPLVGIEEQIGILRADLAALHVALGVDPTDDLVRLNDIATAQINAAKAEKEAL